MKSRKSFQVLVQMDFFSKINKNTDSTYLIALEGLERKHDVFYCLPNDINIHQNELYVRTRKFKFKNKRFVLSQRQKILALNDFDVIFIRQDPPFEMNYVTNTYLHQLNKIAKGKTLYINDPQGIRDFTEKICPLNFKGLIPSTYILNDLDDILSVIKQLGTVVIKPLYDKGGNGVHQLKKNQKDLERKISYLTDHFKRKIIVQEFLKNVSKGDKRILFVNGQPVGAVNRVPQNNSFKANLHLGALAESTDLTKKEKKICDTLEPFFKKNGLFFVGIDIIDEMLTEVNVTSPTGIVQINRLEKIKIEKILWKEIERIF